MIIVDAHEDLAYNSLTFGRNYLRSVLETRTIEAGTQTPVHNGEALIGYPEWVQGHVGLVFATLFAMPLRHTQGDWQTVSYRDSEEAHHQYWAQIKFYRDFIASSQGRLQLIETQPELERLIKKWDPSSVDDSHTEVGFVLLMEGADAIQDPDQLIDWYEAGVRIIGLAWSATRYAGGTREPGPLTKEGFTLLRAMDALGLILDLSHLSDEGARQALDNYDGPVIASHAIPRALVPNAQRPERHLTDEIIRDLAERGGVIGILLANHFMMDGWSKADRNRRDEVDLDEVARHIDHVCQLVGNARHVGIGSDFDGGFGLDLVPTGLDSIADLWRISIALRGRGYQAADIEDVLGGNWLRLLQKALPRNG
jgi:membrane dipeptidase